MLATQRRQILVGTIVVVAVVAVIGALALGRFLLGQQAQGVAERYPEPRFPSYLKAPGTIDDVMPFARAAVRQTGGRTPLGLIKEGEVALMVAPRRSEPIILEAIQRAFTERGVEGRVLWEYELKGITREQEQQIEIAQRWWTAEHGFLEARAIHTGPNGGLAEIEDVEAARAWLRTRRPDLEATLFPEVRLPDIPTRDVAQALIQYLDEHPEVRGVFYGGGGRTSTRQRLRHHGDKFYGNFTYYDRWTVMSKVTEYPSDVWRLSEEKTIEPIGFADRAHVTDPQGTDFTFDLDPTLAERWSKGVYQQGHLYMFPAQATGRYPYSLIEYPALAAEFVWPVQPRVNGVFGGTTNHAGFVPRVEVRVQDGYLREVRGGGLYGDIWREFLNYPGINDLQYPFYERPGYFYLYEAGTGTNPKYFGGANSSERNVAGVIHWAFGAEVQHGPDSPFVPQEWKEFTEAHKLPSSHGWHLHNVLPTYRLRVRGTEQWVTLIDRGRLTSLDSAEVRALASRYGDPTEILKQEWVRHLPGINAPGSYEEYSRDPWNYEKQIDEEIEKGTYRYFSK